MIFSLGYFSGSSSSLFSLSIFKAASYASFLNYSLSRPCCTTLILGFGSKISTVFFFAMGSPSKAIIMEFPRVLRSDFCGIIVDDLRYPLFDSSPQTSVFLSSPSLFFFLRRYPFMKTLTFWIS